MKALDLGGSRFGRLYVLKEAKPVIQPSGRIRKRWECRCECGESVIVRGGDLTSGKTLSCGCYRNEQVDRALRTHGEAKKGKRSAEYKSWYSMISRCENSGNPDFQHYGGRGIMVCALWRQSYEAFLRDMGRKPSPSHTLERLRVNGNYEPGNCVWATNRQQARNKRNTRIVQYRGRAMPLVEAAEIAGIQHKIVRLRIDRYGWSVERALDQPLKQRKNKGERKENQ